MAAAAGRVLKLHAVAVAVSSGSLPEPATAHSTDPGAAGKGANFAQVEMATF